MALERFVFYSSLPCGRAKQIVPALFSKILWDACENNSNHLHQPGIGAIASAGGGRTGATGGIGNGLYPGEIARGCRASRVVPALARALSKARSVAACRGISPEIFRFIHPGQHRRSGAGRAGFRAGQSAIGRGLRRTVGGGGKKEKVDRRTGSRVDTALEETGEAV